jgi:transglutaminase-like putative cysteine protease
MRNTLAFPRPRLNDLRRFASMLVQPQMSSAARERRDIFVLLAAVAVVALPHMDELPWWAIGVLCALWGWRVWLTVAQKPLPGRAWLWPLLFGAGGAVWLQHGTIFGRDAGVLMLLLLMALKLLEMRAKRDVFVVIFLCFFILLTLFLFSQALGTAFITLIAVLLLFFVLTSVNLIDTDLPARAKLALVGLVMLKAVPLTIVLFLLFPRLSGPLWGLPGGGGDSARTGLSNSMAPGAVGRLLESDEIAFRVRFAGRAPNNDALYWRGPTFGFFSGRTWSPLPGRATLPPAAIDVDARSAVDYTVTLEPHSRDWVFALEMTDARGRVGDLNVNSTPEGQLVANGLITSRMRYDLRSFTRYTIDRQLGRVALQPWVQLPPGFNPRTLQYALDLRRRTPGADTRAGDPALVQAVLLLFRNGGFNYTLTPPLLGKNSVDDFLFETRAGYCEHYASAFVTVMRALDIPARVVTGYQGGEFNPVDGFLTVRQSDAHAWAEVWLDGRGWVRIDPTAAVAPDRIERGAPQLARDAAAAGTLGNVAAFDWLRRALFSVRLNWEALQNAWNQWVLSYSPDRQRALLSRLGLEPDWRSLAQALALSLAALLGALAYFSLKHRVEHDPLGEAYARLRGRLAASGIAVAPSLGPRALADVAAAALDPAAREAMRRLLHDYEQLRYARPSSRAARTEVRALAHAITRFRPRRASAGS